MFFIAIQVSKTSVLKPFGQFPMHTNTYKFLNVGTSGQKMLANFANGCVWFLRNGIFSYSCVCPHVQLVNVFFSVIYKDFLLSTGF